jgi:predicted ATPase
MTDTSELNKKKELKLIDKLNNIETNLFTTQNSQFIIEEPELNLFPETQRDLVYYLLEKCSDQAREHRMTITTHSPYILYALNNCMMAGLV